MRISVVIPLFNKAGFVGRALNSILAQTHTEFEVIVVDDGSTDDSGLAVTRVADPRIRLVCQANAGASAARNRGIEEASGDFVAFLDADDEWTPSHLETLARLATRFPECGACASALARMNTERELVPWTFKSIPGAAWEGVIPNYFRAALEGWPLHSSSVMIPKRVFEVVGMFPVGERHGEDLDLWCRIALRYPIAYSNQIGAIYHTDCPQRVTSAVDTNKCYGSLRKTLDRAIASEPQVNGVCQADLRRLRDHYLMELARVLWCQKATAKSLRLLVKIPVRSWLKWDVLRWFAVTALRSRFAPSPSKS